MIHRNDGQWSLRLVLLACLSCCVVATSAEIPGASPAAPVTAAAPLVAAASDLKFALGEIVEHFRRETGIVTRVSLGSSGNLARQIEQGAPFEIFLSADEAYVRRLVDAGLTRDDGSVYAIGRLAFFAPTGSPLEPDPRLESLRRRLDGGDPGRFAIANPDHAPYGRAARQVLQALGLWNAVRPQLVIGENVAQAAQFASDGNTDGGLIAHSLALAPELGRRGRFALVPDELHEPLRQRMVLLRNASPAAIRLYDFMHAPASRAVFERYGFALPPD